MKTLKQHLNESSYGDNVTGLSAKNVRDEIIKNNKNFTWLKTELDNLFSIKELRQILDEAGYSNEVDDAIKRLKKK